MAAAQSARATLPLLAGGALFAGGSAYAAKEFCWRELPPPCQVVARHLEEPSIRSQLGFPPAPWSLRLWHGNVGEHFARVTVPLFEAWSPLPQTMPWLRLFRKRSVLHAALEHVGDDWIFVNLLLEDSSAGSQDRPAPRRTDDILAAEQGRSQQDKHS
eukprot:gnl/TRDRNA2_/TRDRNA2_193009_c0_seq1.p1 gnl/TRDRNA2_/TRDRNA2_193009_c0~~gnl/TRDRNA2_/TRDRNA2_193009_c0_seq1.p1  ORF type:complete len:172 (+),score=21.06 gnl/TRDRNA2_/TRDRNA2_193009_c0_seq1:44-517(+)